MRRIAPLLFAAVLLTGGLSGEFWAAGSGKTLTVARAPVLVASGAVKMSHSVDRKAATRPKATERSVAIMAVRTAEPVVLSGDDAALVAEINELQSLAQGVELGLDSLQWSALAAVTLNIQAIRQTYEAQIAKATMLTPGRYRVEIPVYSNAGDALRANFYAALEAELGATAAAGIVEKLGPRLEGHFGGFGVSLQTLDITADPARGMADCEVTRTVTFSKPVEGGERLTTRRETHFPAWEDPSGERWSALLAVVGA